MMVDLGGGAKERFQSVDVEEHEEPFPPLSSVSHTHYGLRSASWRHTLQRQDTSNRLSGLESMPHNLIQVKSDPDNLDLCIGGSSADSMVALSGPLSPEAAEDARAKGRLLQEITRVAETFEPYNSSSLPSGCYRNYNVSSDAQPHTDYIVTDTSHWSWNRSPSDDKTNIGHNGGGLFTDTASSHETVNNTLQYNIPSHLMPDAFSSPLPPVSVSQSLTSVPSCSPIQRPPPSPPPPSTLASSALDLSPGMPPVAHQLPSLQPSLMTPTSGPVRFESTPPSAHQLPALHPSLISLDVSSQPVSDHNEVDENLKLVGVEALGSGERTMPQFECGECGALFTRLPHLKYHMKIHTEGMDASANKQDDRITNSPNSKFSVQSSEKVFSCKYCSEKFSRADKLKSHELKHPGNRTFRCNDCGTSFYAKAMLVRHRKVHTGEKPYKCDICKTCFTDGGSLKVHKRLHSGEKPFKCNQCDVAFSGAGMLSTHKRKHTGEKPYMCDECGETFRLLSTLKSHRRRHTGEKPFVCDLCGSSFTQRAAMRRHKRIHSDKKPWECDQCGYKFREKENLRKHLALHKIKLQHTCDICGSGFNHAKKLETHKMLHNGGERPYQCNKCPSTFTNPKYLTQHKKRVHEKKGAIRCEECNGTFKRKETLQSHMKIHEGERPYVCEECGAAFNQRGTLTKHLRVHGTYALEKHKNKGVETKSTTPVHVHPDNQSSDQKEGEETFQCSPCNINFSSQKDLARHIRSSHPSHSYSQENSVYDQDDDEHIPDKYICEDCDQTFFRRRQLKAHKKNCPCWCPAFKTEPPEKVGVLTVQNDGTREVDAMKLLTAVLAATGNNVNEVTDLHHSPSTNDYPSSIPSVSSPSSSPSNITSNIEQHHDYHDPLRLFAPCDLSYTEHLHDHCKDSHLKQSPPRHSSHSSQSPHSQHTLLHQAPQSHHQEAHSHLSLEHVPQDILHNPTRNIHPSESQLRHVLLSHSLDHFHHSSRELTHPHQPAQDDTHYLHQHTADHSEHPSRSHAMQQEVSEKEYLSLPERSDSPLQEPLKEQNPFSPCSRHQDTSHHSTRLYILDLKETQMLQESLEESSIDSLQSKENHPQIHPHPHHHIDLIVQGQFFKSLPSSLPGQALQQHHLQQCEETDNVTHFHDYPNQALPNIKHCDPLDHCLQHPTQEQIENCHCHHDHHHDQHLPHHFTYNENDEHDDTDPRLHHQQQQQQQQQQEQQQQRNPLCSTLEYPVDIKIENIFA